MTTYKLEKTQDEYFRDESEVVVNEHQIHSGGVPANALGPDSASAEGKRA